MSGFTTTRGGPRVSLEEALFRGLAPDGGLYVPERLPTLVWPPTGTTASVRTPDADDPRRVARWAAPALFPSVAPSVLARVVDEALTFPIPLVEVERGIWMLELFHGPTHAFKDVGARFTALLMAALDPRPPTTGGEDGGATGAGPGRTVLVATSGDTGGAVASAFHRRPGYRAVALFPREGISERQRRQMTTLGDNVHAVAVDGTFDDCQRMAKEAFRDRDLAGRHRLTSANSINVARLLPQAFYYMHAAHRLEAAGGGPGRRAHFVVPAGNLGNLCAGLLAARAGMPAAGFTAATNENRAFADYLQGAPFQARRSVATTSSAMDVGDPSNLERIVWLYGGDDEAVRRAVSGLSVARDEVRRRIADLHARTGYVADPHTAVAYAAAKRQNGPSERPLVVLATAHPAKFPETVEDAIGEAVEPPPALRAIYERDEEMHTIPAHVDALGSLLVELAPTGRETP